MLEALVSALLVLLVSYLMGKRHFYVFSTVDIEALDYQELFNFVTDISNDHKWYAGIETTEVVAAGGEDFVGKKYVQKGKFNGIPFENHIEVITTALNGERIYLSFLGTGGAVWYTVQYIFEKTPQGARFTNLSTVASLRMGYLFSNPSALIFPEQSCKELADYTHASGERLLKAFGKNGQAQIHKVHLMQH